MTTNENRVTVPDVEWRAYPELAIPPILASALHHFHQLGYHGTTIRKIAIGVDLTMPTLYYHYGNKEGLLYALLELAMDDLERHIDLALEDAGDDATARLANFITTVALHYTYRHDLAMLHAEYRFLTAELQAKYTSRRRKVEDTLAGLLTEGIVSGALRDEDPRFTTRAILGMVSGILDWYTSAGPLSAEEVASLFTERALRIVMQPGTI